MEISIKKKNKTLKLVSSLYFILLSLFSLFATLSNSGLNFFDLFILLFTLSLIILNKNWYYIFFGIISMLISLYILLAILIKGLSYNPKQGNFLPTEASYFIGLTLVILSLLASLIMIYSSINRSSKTFSFI